MHQLFNSKLSEGIDGSSGRICVQRDQYFVASHLTSAVEPGWVEKALRTLSCFSGEWDCHTQKLSRDSERALQSSVVST